MNGSPLECSKNGTEVEKGSVVTFTATPTDDYTFSGWVGSISGKETPKTVTIKENMFVTVDFALKRFAVNYECVPVEGGVITATADGQSLAESGTEVENIKTSLLKQPLAMDITSTIGMAGKAPPLLAKTIPYK